jgi:hypothetical protein
MHDGSMQTNQSKDYQRSQGNNGLAWRGAGREGIGHIREQVGYWEGVGIG